MCIIYSWTVVPEHRKKGLAMLMFGGTTLQAWKRKMKYAGGPVGESVKNNASMAKKIGGKICRTYLVLEREL
ncbi:MAG: hypothetical protein ACTSRI_05085 [Promethearchaeota archaeon]